MSDIKNWLVIYTKSRSEKVVAERLRENGFEVYCPLRKTKRKWSDRVKTIEEPLFKSYLFILLSERERLKMLFVPGMVRFVFWQGKPAIVRESEINLLKRWLNDFDHEDIHIKQFKLGDKIQIQSGLFMNMDGVLTQQKGKKIKLYLEALNMMISIDTKNNIVEKLAS